MRIRIPILAVSVAGLSLASLSFAAEVETIGFEKLSQADRTTISSAGSAAIHDIVGARVSLERKEGPAARLALGQAAEKLRLVRKTSPSANLADGVSALHDKLVKGEGGNPQDLEPIYTRLDAYKAVAGEGSAEEMRVKLNNAKGKLAAGQDEEAAILLEGVSESISYVEIDLPVRETLVRVERAITQIGNDDYLGADANLRESLGSVRTFGEMASIQMDKEIEAVGTAPAP